MFPSARLSTVFYYILCSFKKILSIILTIIDEKCRWFFSGNYLGYIQKYATNQPRTYWVSIPFYTIIKGARQRFLFGYRPEDLSHIETIEQKAWNKHQAHLDRLERFPLEKAEYYVRIKESQGISSVRGLAQVTGEDWSYIAKILRTLELPETIKDFFKSNKNDPAVLRFFHLRRMIDIVQQREERLQLTGGQKYISVVVEDDFKVSLTGVTITSDSRRESFLGNITFNNTSSPEFDLTSIPGSGFDNMPDVLTKCLNSQGKRVFDYYRN